MGRRPWRYEWESAVLSPCGPPSTTRLVLLALATFGDTEGRDIHPGIERVAERAGLSPKRTGDHIRRAVGLGWIERRHVHEGHGWRRSAYFLRIPNAEREDGASPRDVEREDGASPRDVEREDVPSLTWGRSVPNVGTERPPTSPDTRPGNSGSELSGSADADRTPAHEICEALEAGPDALASVVRLAGFGSEEARWVRDGARRAEFRLTREFGVADLVAVALADLVRRRRGWGRQRFVRYVEAAIRARLGDRADDLVPWVIPLFEKAEPGTVTGSADS